MAAATLQSLVGVTDEAVAADYAATTEWFARHLDDHPDLQSAPSRAAYAPAPETMHIWLDGVRTEFGSVEQMLLESGATSAAIATLRDRYVE